MIEINFPSLQCSKCACAEHYAIEKANRYGIYCKGCGKFIKWADRSQTTVINARKDWLNEHENTKNY